MKTFLTRLIRSVFYPLIWCRRVVLEASEVCLDYDPIGFSDYMDYREARPALSTLPAAHHFSRRKFPCRAHS